ncbi:hypothetical protein [Pseudomonas cerasi]
MKQRSYKTTIMVNGDTRGLVRPPLVGMLILLGILFLCAIVALFYIADKQNTHEDQHLQLLMGKAIENRQEIMHAHTMDNADWGEAWRNLAKPASDGEHEMGLGRSEPWGIPV